MADKKRMSVGEMLAAARKADGGDAAPADETPPEDAGSTDSNAGDAESAASASASAVLKNQVGRLLRRIPQQKPLPKSRLPSRRLKKHPLRVLPLSREIRQAF